MEGGEFLSIGIVVRIGRIYYNFFRVVLCFYYFFMWNKVYKRKRFCLVGGKLF